MTGAQPLLQCAGIFAQGLGDPPDRHPGGDHSRHLVKQVLPRHPGCSAPTLESGGQQLRAGFRSRWCGRSRQFLNKAGDEALMRLDGLAQGLSHIAEQMPAIGNLNGLRGSAPARSRAMITTPGWA
jgi:hypothetical protein